ncbi:beta strand repeat-containing protein [Culicoidibacter larvae]|uniref:Uncharacterized protein n=1 Tax=Culicoidibacter larvae TaxID=2579976 RepID=A0A5R8QH92_9FIRM|nr:hypothetical protein [Culicoidibacter larvae]TLG77368.1 hypothetical protein FEZ08_01745 [Culicoidibacter larvae]
MNNSIAKKFIRIFLATTILSGSSVVFFDILANSMPVSAASEPITIDSGTEHEYTIPVDSSEKIETEIPDGYVQSNTKKPNFNKENLKAYSGPVPSEIKNAFQISDNQFINILAMEGTVSQEPAVGISTMYAVLTDKQGNILSSKSIPKNINESSPPLVDSESIGEYARYSMSTQNGNSVQVFYRGQIPGDNNIDNRIATITVDGSNNISTIYSTISKGTYVPQQPVQMFNFIKGINQNVVTGDLQKSVWNLKHFEVYYINDSGVYSEQKVLTAPDYSQMLPGYDDENKFLFITSDNMVSTADGGFAATVIAYDPTISRYAVVVWNADGSIKYQYNLNAGDRITSQSDLSDSNTYYFLERKSSGGATLLQKMDLVTGDVSTLQEFPSGTNIRIYPDYDSTYGTEYSYYGSIKSATGPFAGIDDSGNGGAVTGTMSQDFSIYNASLISANGTVQQNFSKNIDGALYFTGGRTSATDFAEKPAGGWVSTNNAFFGTMTLIDDYAPALKVGSPVMINKDSVTNWDSELLNGVSVIDVFDLTKDLGNRDQSWLDERINRNPLDVELGYDWAALGLDKTKVGPNTVTYFVTDSSMQITADSKIVNVVANSTKYDSGKIVALDAHSFAISLQEAKDLTDTQAKDATYGNVVSWDMLTGTALDGNVTVDPAELATITNATAAGVYPLTYSIVENGVTVTNTIKVFVTDSSTIVDPANDVVLYANDFSVQLNVVASFDSNAALSESSAKAYSYSTGDQYPITSLSADVSAVRVATTVGPVNMDITFTGSSTTTTSVIASVLNEDTDIASDNSLALFAQNFTINLDDVTTLDAKAAAEVKAWNMNTGNDLTYKVKPDSTELAAITGAQNAGLYNLTFLVQDDQGDPDAQPGPVVSNTITVFVTDDNTKVNGDLILFANDFNLHLDEVADATSDSLKNLSGAKAYKISTAGELPDANITADTTAVKGATAVGPVNVSITYSDGTDTVTTVVASIIDDNTVINDSEAIYATNFKVAVNDVAGLDDDAIITRANAKAWNMKDGTGIDISVNGAIQATAGAYSVTFSTDAGTEKTIIATVFDDDMVIDDAKGKAIYARSFTVDIAQVDTLNSAAIIDLAGARAWSTIDGSDIDVSVASNGIQKLAGVYDVTFTTDAGTTRAVKVTVKDDNTVIDNGEALYATDFRISSDEVDGLDDVTVNAKAGAKAWKLNDGSSVSFTTEFSSIVKTPGTYPVTFTTDAGTSAVIYATVYDEDTVIDDNNDEAIYARDFIVDKSAVATLDKTAVDDLAAAKAWKLEDGSTVTFATDFAAIQDQVGAYPVAFTTTAGTTISVIASVVDADTTFDDVNKEAIYAHNFTVTTDEVATLSKTIVDGKAETKAWNTDTGALLTWVTDFSAVQSAAGAYPVIFTTTAGTTRTIMVSVTDDETIVDPVTNEALRATDFIVNLNNVATLDKTAVDTLAGAKAWKLEDGSPVTFTTAFSIAEQVGVYPVTFTTDAGTSKTVLASVVDGNTNYDVNHTVALYANNFSVALEDAANLNEAMVKDATHAAVKAWNMTSGADVTANITVNSSELQAIQNASNAGPYSLTFEVVEAGATVNKVITVFVTDDNTIVDPDKNVVLYANDFTMQLIDAASATSAQVKTLTDAKAYNYATGAQLSDTNISADVSALNTASVAEPVNVPVIFNDGNIITQVVIGSLIDEDTALDPDKNEALHAANFTLDKSEVSGLTKTIVDGKAGAKAWKLSDGSTVTFDTDFTAIAEAAGAYPVTFTTTTGVTKTVYATVTDSDTIVDPAKDTAVYAANFTLDKSEVSGLTKMIVDGKAGAKAWKLSDGSEVTFDTDFTAIQAQAGVYPVSFTTTTGVSKTVYATVTDADTIVDPDKDTVLYAANFTLNKSEVSGLTKAIVDGKAEAKAWKLSDGSEVAFDTDFTAVAEAAGAYPVTFTTTTGVTKTVYATVSDADTVVDPAKDTALYAHGFMIDKTEVAGLTKAIVDGKAEAKAWKLSDGSEVAFDTNFTAVTEAVGVYLIVFTTTTGVEQTVYVTVTDNNTVINGDEALYARNFSMEASDVASLDDTQIILLAEAKAWNINDGNSIPFTVDASQLLAEVGTYPVTFATAAGTERTIYVTVVDDNTVVVNDEALYAHSFIINIDEVAGLDEATVLAKSEAKAWNVNDLSPVSVSADFSMISAKAGAYPVQVKTVHGTTRTVYATVVDDKTVVTGDVAVRADNFELLVSQVAGLSDAQVRELAGFQAWLVNGGQDVSDYFNVDYSQVVGAVGSYAVIFDGTAIQQYSGDLISKTVIANVVADPINPDLPITGGNEFEFGLIGLLSVIAGAALIIRRKNR